MFHHQRPRKNLLGLQIHGIHQSSQLVQLLHTSFAEQCVALNIAGGDFRGAVAAYDIRGGPATEFLYGDHLVPDLVHFRREADVCYIIAK